VSEEAHRISMKQSKEKLHFVSHVYPVFDLCLTKKFLGTPIGGPARFLLAHTTTRFPLQIKIKKNCRKIVMKYTNTESRPHRGGGGTNKEKSSYER